MEKDAQPQPEGIVLKPLGETELISPKNRKYFTPEELSEIIGGQLTIVPLTNEEHPRRRRRIMCINAEGKDQNLDFNAKAHSIFDVSCWGSAIIMNVRDMLY